MRDFTLEKYRKLIEYLKSRQYNFQSFRDYILKPIEKTIILRHDVDRLPINALTMAEIEKEYGINSSYYFRYIPGIFNEEIIVKITGLGHEVGFHYETVDTVTSDKLKVTSNKDEIIDRAYELFCEKLEEFRKIAEIKTICMHGSPRGKWDNRIIWEKYNYRDLGIIGEPYFDVDWNELGYLTDTGRRWNGDKYNVRDKVNSKYNFNLASTNHIINNIDNLPDKLMINIHPHRWFNFGIMWIREFILQNTKNTVKYIIVRRQK